MLKFIQRLFSGFQSPPMGNGTTPTSAQPPAGGSNTGPGLTGVVMQGVGQTVAPITQKYDLFSIQTMPVDGRLIAHAEIAGENADGSMTVATRNTRLETGSGAVVAPEQVVSRCGHPGCGQVEAALLRCDACGAARCFRHCRQINLGGEDRIYCLEHLEQLLNTWDSWAQYDFVRGILRPPSGSPPTPNAVRQPTYLPRHENHDTTDRRREGRDYPGTR